MLTSVSVCLFVVNLTQPQVTREEETSTENMPPSDCLVGSHS